MQQTKKSFKFLNALYLLLLLPLVFLFTACGESPTTKQLSTEATCSTSGDYAQASTQEAYETAVQDKTIGQGAYRVTITGTEGGQDMYVNLIMSGSDMSMKMRMQDPTSEKAKTVEMYTYYTGGKIYNSMAFQGKTYKVYMEMDLESALSEQAEGAAMFDVQSVLDAIKKAGDLDIFTDANGNFKLSTKEGGSFEMDGATITKATAYLNFDADKNLTALKMTYEGSHLNDDGETVEMSGTVTMSAFSGKIAFPDLSSYKSLEEIMAGMFQPE